MIIVSTCSVAQSCPSLCDPINRSLPGSSVHGTFQARILEWVAISFSRGSSQPRDWTQVSCTARSFFPIWATCKAHSQFNHTQIEYDGHGKFGLSHISATENLNFIWILPDRKTPPAVFRIPASLNLRVSRFPLVTMQQYGPLLILT